MLLSTPTLSLKLADISGGSAPYNSINSGLVTFTQVTLKDSLGAAVRVAVLACRDGEQSFTDLNRGNIWQPGEPFFDMGTVFRDDNESNSAAGQKMYPGGAVGTSACMGNANSYPSVANPCDGTSRSSIRVPKQLVFVFSTDHTQIAQLGAKALGGFKIRIADVNGNSMATGSTVAAAVTNSGSTCAVISVLPAKVLNPTTPTQHAVTFNADPSCSSATVQVTVASTGGLETAASF